MMFRRSLAAALLISPLFAAPAFADDAADCAGSDPAKQFDKAMPDFNHAARLDPQNAQVYKERAGAYALKGQTAQALADADKAIKLAPEYVEALALRALINEKLGQGYKAVEDYRKVLALAPSHQKSKDALKRLGDAP